MRVNRAWEQFTGRSRDQVIGRAARSWLPLEEARTHDEVDRRLLSGLELSSFNQLAAGRANSQMYLSSGLSI